MCSALVGIMKGIQTKLISYVIFISLFGILVCACEHPDQTLSSTDLNQHRYDTLLIDNSKINFSVHYQLNGVEIKDLLKKDTIEMFISYEENLFKASETNEIQILPNVRDCKIKKIDNQQFIIAFGKNYSDPVFRYTMYLEPTHNVIFSVNEKKYYSPSSKLFIAEKLNTVEL